MAKVAPGDAGLPGVESDFPKAPVYGTNVSRYPEDYLAAKARTGGDQYLELKDGRRICYFKDGT